MQKHNYYYLIAGLPDMAPEQSKVPLPLPELMEAFRISLHPGDLQSVRMIFYPYDDQNLLKLLQKEDSGWHPLGRLTREEIEEGLKEPGELPSYMNRFYQAYKNEAPLWPELSWENQLTRLRYAYLIAHTRGFLKQWFTFENHLRNLLAAWNIREHQLEAEGQFIGDNFITEAVRKSHARDFGLAAELPFIDKLMHALEQDGLLERERAISLIKWNYIDELNTFHYFTAEVVLGYLLKWIMLNRWTQMDPKKGQQVIGTLIEKLENSFEFPKTFALA